LAIVTGASTGIGLELARCCARAGFDLLIVANEPEIEAAAGSCRVLGAETEAVIADLASTGGIDAVYGAVRGRAVSALLANAGTGLGRAFLDQEFSAVRHIIDTNITGTLELIHRVGMDMRSRGSGRILITGSIAGFVPGPYHAVYNASKAFIDSFSWALRKELEECGVSVTCLMPGATETRFFERAEMLDTKLGQAKKDDAAEVARVGFDAMMRGDGDIIPGLANKVTAAAAAVTPSSILASGHAAAAKPGSAAR
jgi:short-subunit dehydrogenase